MLKYRAYFKPSAEKELIYLPRDVAETTISKINDLLKIIGQFYVPKD